MDVDRRAEQFFVDGGISDLLIVDGADSELHAVRFSHADYTKSPPALIGLYPLATGVALGNDVRL